MGGQLALNPLSDVLEAAPSIFALTRELHFWQVRVMSDPHSNIFKVARISVRRRSFLGQAPILEGGGVNGGENSRGFYLGAGQFFFIFKWPEK